MLTAMSGSLKHNFIMKMGSFSASDRLAVVLACLTAIQAVIFSWLNKTQLSCVVSSVLIVLLAIYPIFHFLTHWKLRITSLFFVVLMAGFFWWCVSPPKASVKTESSGSEKSVHATDSVPKHADLKISDAEKAKRDFVPPISIQQTDHSIINIAPNRGSQRIEDNRSYGVPEDAPNIKFTQSPQEPILPESSPAASDPAMLNPGVSAKVVVIGRFSRPRFRVTCDVPCVLTHGFAANGVITNIHRPVVESNGGRTLDIILSSPSLMEEQDEVDFFFRSKDNRLVSISDIAAYVDPIANRR